jgi:acetone carboxylase gamma subunit
VKETKSIKIFENQIPDEWICRRITNPDYALDMEIEITSEEEVSGKTLLVQLKSSDFYSPKRGFIHYPFDTRKLQYYLKKDLPVILVLVDLIKEQCYWVFVQEYIYEELEKSDPLWRQRRTTTLKIPITNMLSQSIPALADLAFQGPLYIVMKGRLPIHTETLLAQAKLPQNMLDFTSILLSRFKKEIFPAPVLHEIVYLNESRYKGLKREFMSLKMMWENLSNADRDQEILPKTPAFDVIEGFLERAKKASKKIKDLTRCPAKQMSTSEFEEKGRLSGIANGNLKAAALLLNLLRMSFYERTVLLWKPSTVSEETGGTSRRVDHLLLQAIDNLARSYVSQLDMHGRVWDGVVSYYSDSKFAGPRYYSFGRVFHISLSLDMKYFAPSYISIAHEVAHAACESMLASIERRQFVPEAIYNFLHLLFPVRSLVWRYIGLSSKKKRCEACVYYDDLRMMSQIKDRKRFVRFVAFDTSLIVLLHEIVADTVSLVIAGPNYLNVLSDFVFNRNRDELRYPGEVILKKYVVDTVARISACQAYAELRNLEWKNECKIALEKVLEETTRLPPKLGIEEKQQRQMCTWCAVKLGKLTGTILGLNSEEILGYVFLPHKILITKSQIIDKLRRGHLISDEEPRAVLHAYIELAKQKKHVDTVVFLRSLAESTGASKVTTQ